MRRHTLSGLFASLAGLYRVYYATLRVDGFLPDGSRETPATYPFGRKIFALCERDAAALGGVLFGRGFTSLVSPGRDGDWATAAMERLGCRVVRGSSRRGGARALAELIRTLSLAPGPAAVVVDGPLGPSGEAKPGILLCARRTARPIVPLGAATRRALVLTRAWSRLYVPLPFARVVVVLGPALDVAEGTPREELPALAVELSRRLASCRARALEIAGGALAA